MKTNIKVKIDINKDAWNYWQACSNQGLHGMDWSKRAEPIVLENVAGKTEAEAYAWLLPYLEQKYKEIDINVWAKQIQAELMPEYPKVMRVVEEITQKPFYLEDINLFVTTFNRSPYDWWKGSIWIVFDSSKDRIIRTLVHEMLHFQFHYYYGDKVIDEVGKAKFEAIKEGMTLILNDYLFEWTGIKETTYTIYEELAKELLNLWKSSSHDFKKFIEGSIKVVEKYDF